MSMYGKNHYNIKKREREKKKKISARVVEILEDQNENGLVHLGIFPEVWGYCHVCSLLGVNVYGPATEPLSLV